jgi:cupin fold WbuC family metalloprotein
MRELSPEVLVADDSLVLIKADDIRNVVARARSTPRRRARILLHQAVSDVMQEMLIVMMRGQYVPPHRNDTYPNS